MKRTLALLLVMIFAFAAFAACENQSADTSSSEQPQSEAASSSPESAADSAQSSESSESSAPESGADSAEPVSIDPETATLPAVEVLYCSFSEKPYYAMVGKCLEGATVHAYTEKGEVSAESWHGWFSLRLYCGGASSEVDLWQTVGDETSALLSYTARPKTPGADMWPIVTGTGNFQFYFQKMLPDYRKSNLPSKGALDNLTKKVAEHVKTVRDYSTSAEVIYVIAPSSMTVYPEYVPEQYKSPEGDSKLDAVSKALADGGATVIDLRKTYAGHKNDEMPLYYHLDSHWADYGAYLAYYQLFEHISKTFPAAKPREADEFDWVGDFYDSGDMTYYLAMPQTEVKEYCWFRRFKEDSGASESITSVPRYRRATSLTYSDQATQEMRFDTGNAALPNVMVLRDSYSTQLFDLIADRSYKSHFYGMWDYTWRNDVIKREQPDYVIYVIAEWNIDSIIRG